MKSANAIICNGNHVVKVVAVGAYVRAGLMLKGELR